MLTFGSVIVFGIVIILSLMGLLYLGVEKTKIKIVFLSSFLVLLVASLFTLREYFYPEPSVFENVNYHHLEHQGYQFTNDSLVLIDFEKPNEALWDNREGQLTLKVDSLGYELHTKGLGSPLFTRVDQEQYRLQDRYNSFAFGHTLEIKRRIDTLSKETIPLFKLFVSQVFDANDSEATYVLEMFGDSTRRDTSDFKSVLFSGYPLEELTFANSNVGNLPFDLQRNYLTRRWVQDPMKAPKRKKEELIKYDPENLKLIFCPSIDILENDEWVIFCDGAEQQRTYSQQNTVFKAGGWNMDFFLGIGKDRSQVLKLSRDSLEKEKKWVHQAYFGKPRQFSLRDDADTVWTDEPEPKIVKQITQFITSNAQEILKFDEDKVQGGFYINHFFGENNINQVNARFKYRVGTSKELMPFVVYDFMKSVDNIEDQAVPVSAEKDKGQFLLYTANEQAGLSWMMAFKNRRHDNWLKLWHVQAFLIAFFFCVVVRSFAIDEMPLVEMGIYIVVFCFLVIRLFLHWRIATFYPLEGISQPMQAILMDAKEQFKRTSILTGLFLMAAWSTIKKVRENVLNVFINWNILWARHWMSHATPSWTGFYVVAIGAVFLVVVIATYLGNESFARMQNLLLPLLFYFLAQIHLDRIRRYLVDLNDWVGDFIKQTNVLPYVVDLITFCLFVFLDAGYSIMFLMFVFIFRSLMWLTVMKSYGKQLDPPWRIILFLAAAISLFFLIKYQNYMVVFGMENLVMIIQVFLIFLIVATLIFHFAVQRINPIQYTGGSRVKLLVITSFMALAFVTLFDENLQEKADQYSYIKYRAGILSTDVDQLMIENNFDSKYNRQILRSSHNQWLINYFIDPEKQPDFFELKPHFDQGASHVVQTTDLVVPRYLIAEHGEQIALKLIALLFSLLLLFYFSMADALSPKHFNLLGITLLLFISAFFVWLTATNRLTFFGQDFPLISATSIATLVIVYALFLILLTTFDADKENTKLAKESISGFSVFFALILLVLTVLFYNKLENSKLVGNPDRFDITRLITKADQEVKKMNRRFLRFQRADLNRNRTQRLDSILYYFHGVKQGQSDQEVTERLTDIGLDSVKFIRTAYKKFLLEQPDKRDPRAFIHVRKRGDLYHLTLNRQFFFIESPESKVGKWEGGVLAASDTRISGLIDKSGDFIDQSYVEDGQVVTNLLEPLLNPVGSNTSLFGNMKMAVVPASWTEGGRDKAYLIRIKGKAKQPENRSIYQIRNGEFVYQSNMVPDSVNKTIKLEFDDFILLEYPESNPKAGRKKQFRFVKESERYLAKKLWINGDMRLFYPLGKIFNWSFSYANLVNSYKNEQLADSESSSKDERISIDYRLTQDIHQQIERKARTEAKRRWARSGSSDLETDFTSFRSLSFEQKKSPSLKAIKHLKLVNKEGVFMLEVANVAQLSEEARNRVMKDYFGPVRRINQKMMRSYYYKSIADPEEKNNFLNQKIDEEIQDKYNFSMVAVDGNGRVRLMMDYNKILRADPNNIREYYAFLNNLYQSSNISTEREYFGNKAILGADIGVGSTLKPIVYAAVTSQAKIDWHKWSVTPVSGEMYGQIVKKNEVTNRYELAFYAGRAFRDRVTWNIDYGNYVRHLKSKEYLPHSNNVYHSTILFLGSYQPYEIEDQLMERVLHPLPKNYRNRMEYCYPIIDYNGEKIFNDKWPDFSDEKSALARGLYGNFALITIDEQRQHLPSALRSYTPFGNNYHKAMFERAAQKRFSHFYWSYPEWSDFLQNDRKVIPIERKGLANPTLGASPIYITPLKMTEMAARLFTMNKAFELTLDDEYPGDSLIYEFFDYSPRWGNQKKLFSFYQNYIYQGMRDAAKTGTAKGLKELSEKLEKRGYYLYVKTGTLSDSESSGKELKLRNKRLLVVLTNKPIHNSRKTSVSDLKTLKLYTMFITVDDIPNSLFNQHFGSSWAQAEPFIEQVTQSSTFKKYMND